MRGYTQLIQDERRQIYALIKAGQNQTEVVHLPGRHKSTISKMFRRNKGL